MVIVVLEPNETKLMLRLAAAAHEQWKQATGHYGDNRLHRHQTGKTGELAVAKFLDSQGVPCDRAFSDMSREGEADVIAPNGRIEVKTWSSHWWTAGGRCVTPTQLPHIQRKADIVIWCVIAGPPENGEVDLRGWSTIAEIAARPVIDTSVGGHTVRNHQVPESELHSIDDLVSLIKGV